MQWNRHLAVLAMLGAVGAGAGAQAALADAPADPAPVAYQTPDAAIFASSNTAVITDPGDPRLQRKLRGFERRVERIIEEGGGVPLDSELLDGVFFSSDSGQTTFERSREFAVDDVTDAELGAIAEQIRVRFGQESVLTFDHLPDPKEVDAFEAEIPGVDAARLRQALLADPVAAARLVGGSVTLDERLTLIAGVEDFAFVRQFVTERLGADFASAELHFGDREFVG